MRAGARVADESGIVEVTVSFPHELGEDRVDMKLAEGTIYNGLWKAEWKAHNVIDKEYISQFSIKNSYGKVKEKIIPWSDIFFPPCTGVTLDEESYFGNTDSSASIGCKCANLGRSFTAFWQDYTSEIWDIIPASDTDIDCAGATCSNSIGTSYIYKDVVCKAPGVYDIRCYGSDSDYDYATLTCYYKSDIPYALSVKNNKAVFEFMDNSVIYSATSTTSVNNGEWHHILAIYDGADIKMYVNGVLEDTNSNPIGNLPINDGNIRIGADYKTIPENFFNGTIDEVRIYNRALSPTEVRDLYNADSRKLYANSGDSSQIYINSPTPDQYATSLVGKWTFDGPDFNWNAGTTVDGSSQQNNGLNRNISAIKSAIGLPGVRRRLSFNL